jgi:hypothetical protein
MTTGHGSTYALAFENYLFRGVAMPTPPTQVWVQFHLGDPGTGSANQATNTTRYQATFSAAAVVGSNGQIVNSGTITLPSVPATETYTHWSAWTASTSGTLLRTGTVAGGGVTAGTSPTIAAGALVSDLGVAS